MLKDGPEREEVTRSGDTSSGLAEVEGRGGVGRLDGRSVTMQT